MLADENFTPDFGHLPRFDGRGSIVSLSKRNSSGSFSSQATSQTSEGPGGGRWVLGPASVSPERGGFFEAASNYKTELCKNFQLLGFCEWGPRCCFAHGRAELRPKILDWRYRSRNCRQFFESGLCKYGARCQYRHASEAIDADLDAFSAHVFRLLAKGQSLVSSLRSAPFELRRVPAFQNLEKRSPWI